MEFDKLNEYADQQALQKQTQFILDLFTSLEEKGLETANKLKSSFNIFDNKTSGTKAMADELKNSSLTASNYQKILASLANEVDKLSEAQKQSLKDINERFKAEEQARAGAKETVKLIATEIQQNEKLEAGRSQLAKTIASNKIALQQQNKELTQAAKLKDAEAGSNQRLDATIAVLTQRLNKLNQTTDEGKAKAELYVKSIGKLFDLRKQNADPKTAQAMNIGNYQGSAQIIVDAMEKARVKVQQTTAEFGKLSPEAGQATREFDALRKITDNPQFLNISAKIGDVRAETRFFVNQLAQLRSEGMQNTQVFKDTEARLAELTSTMRQTKEEVKALSSEHRGVDLFAESVSTVAHAYEVAAGASALFGADQQNIQKVTEKLVAIMAVSNGIKEISTQLTQKGTAANKVYAFFQGLVAKVMDTTATSAARLKAALLTTGIGALIIGLGVLISKLDIFGNDSDKATEETDRLTKAFEAQKKAIDDVNDSLEFQGNIRAERLKQQDADDQKLYENELRTKQAQLKNLEKLEDDSYAQRKEAVINFQNDIQKVYQQFGDNMSMNEDSKKNALARYEAYNSALASATENRVKKERELELFKEQYKTKVHKDGLKQQEDDDKKAAAEAKKRAEQAMKDALELEKRKAAALAEIVKENLNEQIRQQQKIIDDDKTGLNAKITAEQNIRLNRGLLLSAEFNAAIANETKIEDGKKVIVEKSAEEKNLARIKYENGWLAMVDESLKKEQDLRKADVEKQKQSIEELRKFLNEGADQTGTNATDINAIKKNNALMQLDKAFMDGKLKNVEEYETRKAAIEKSFDKKDIEVALETAEAKLEIAVLFGDNTLDLEKTISDLKLQLYDLDFEKAKDTAAKKLEVEKELADRKKQLISDGKDLLISIIDGQFDKQKSQIDQLIQLNNDQKDAEINRISQTTAAETEKAAEIAIVNAQAQAKNEQLQKRQKQLDLQKAEFDRIVALAEIVANVARAVTADLKGNKFLIPFDIATGAIQIAALLAKPLPKFKDGLFGDYEGWAITGDGGKKEVIKRAAGGFEVTPAKDTITWINKGDRIDPDADEFFKGLQFGALAAASRIASGSTQEENYAEVMVKSIQNGLQANAAKIVGAIDNLPQLKMGATRGGMEALWKHGANSYKYINENTNWE